MDAQQVSIARGSAVRAHATRRLRRVTASIGLASVVAGGAVAVVLPGPAHSGHGASPAANSTRLRSGSRADNGSAAGSRSRSRSLSPSAAPTRSSGSGSVVSGGS